MKKTFSKPLDITKLQAHVVDNLKSYQADMSRRGSKYNRIAKINVSSCYICGSITKKQLVKIFGSDYVACGKCTHVYLTKRLSDSQLSNFYSENDSYANTYTDKRQIRYRQQQVAAPKAEFALKEMKFRKQNKTWLDVGCAIGDLVDVVDKKQGWKAKGIDISRSSIEAGKKLFKVDLAQKSFKELISSEKQSYDVISFFGYLGLISDPLDELKLARKNLNKGGYVVIGEENANSLSTIVQQSFPEATTRHLIPPNAINMFTTNSIKVALKKAGFEGVAIWHFGLDFNEFIKVLSLVNKDFGQSSVRQFLQKNSNQFQGVIDNLELSDYMIIVAKCI